MLDKRRFSYSEGLCFFLAATSLLLISKATALAAILSTVYFFSSLHTGASKKKKNRLAKTKMVVNEKRISLAKLIKLNLNTWVDMLSMNRKYMN